VSPLTDLSMLMCLVVSALENAKDRVMRAINVTQISIVLFTGSTHECWHMHAVVILLFQLKIDRSFLKIGRHFSDQLTYMNIFRRCDFKNHLENYKILRHYNVNESDHNVWDEIFGYLQERGVNIQNLNFLKSQVYSGLAEPDRFLETKQKYLDRVRGDPQLMKMLYRMYFYDFVMFGYKLPDIG
jgi:hypothetical protein